MRSNFSSANGSSFIRRIEVIRLVKRLVQNILNASLLLVKNHIRSHQKSSSFLLRLRLICLAAAVDLPLRGSCTVYSSVRFCWSRLIAASLSNLSECDSQLLSLSSTASKSCTCSFDCFCDDDDAAVAVLADCRRPF